MNITYWLTELTDPSYFTNNDFYLPRNKGRVNEAASRDAVATSKYGENTLILIWGRRLKMVDSRSTVISIYELIITCKQLLMTIKRSYVLILSYALTPAHFERQLCILTGMSYGVESGWECEGAGRARLFVGVTVVGVIFVEKGARGVSRLQV